MDFYLQKTEPHAPFCYDEVGVLKATSVIFPMKTFPCNDVKGRSNSSLDMQKIRSVPLSTPERLLSKGAKLRFFPQ